MQTLTIEAKTNNLALIRSHVFQRVGRRKRSGCQQLSPTPQAPGSCSEHTRVLAASTAPCKATSELLACAAMQPAAEVSASQDRFGSYVALSQSLSIRPSWQSEGYILTFQLAMGFGSPGGYEDVYTHKLLCF